jgi:hypothetical protein
MEVGRGQKDGGEKVQSDPHASCAETACARPCACASLRRHLPARAPAGPLTWSPSPRLPTRWTCGVAERACGLQCDAGLRGIKSRLKVGRGQAWNPPMRKYAAAAPGTSLRRAPPCACNPLHPAPPTRSRGAVHPEGRHAGRAQMAPVLGSGVRLKNLGAQGGGAHNGQVAHGCLGAHRRACRALQRGDPVCVWPAAPQLYVLVTLFASPLWFSPWPFAGSQRVGDVCDIHGPDAQCPADGRAVLQQAAGAWGVPRGSFGGTRGAWCLKPARHVKPAPI